MVPSKGTEHGRLAALCFGSRAGLGRNERLRSGDTNTEGRKCGISRECWEDGMNNISIY